MLCEYGDDAEKIQKNTEKVQKRDIDPTHVMAE
jgi:hypothetical protein